MEQKIIEGNKLIAEFMGWDEETLLLPYINGGKGTCRISEFQYNSSWDWLIPAIRKMRDYLQNIERPSRNHCCKGDMLEVDVQCHLWELDIEKTFSSLLPLIDWYNKEQSDKRSVATMQ